MQRSGHPRFYELIETISDLHHRKSSNYARKEEPLSNFQECSRFGISPFDGVLVRMSDKWSRIKELSGGTPDAVGESVKDTLMDLAVYSLIAIILYEETETKESSGYRREDSPAEQFEKQREVARAALSGVTDYHRGTSDPCPPTYQEPDSGERYAQRLSAGAMSAPGRIAG